MDSQTTMILMCGVIGIMMVVASPVAGVAVGVIGGIVCVIPSVIIYMNVRKTGLLLLMQPQKRGDTIVLYISSTRRIYPMLGRELLERYIKLPGYGRIRVTANSDYLLAGKKVVIGMQGSAATIPVEIAFFGSVLERLGFRKLDNAKAFYDKVIAKIRKELIKEGAEEESATTEKDTGLGAPDVA